MTGLSSTPSKARLCCVDPAQVWGVWPHAREFIRRAIDRVGISDFAAIEAQVLSGEQLLWLCHDGKQIEAAATTQLVNVGERRICVLVACGGRGDWPALMEQIETYATDEKCTALRLYGRKGWERVLKGYLARYVILERELAHGRPEQQHQHIAEQYVAMGGSDAGSLGANEPATGTRPE